LQHDYRARCVPILRPPQAINPSHSLQPTGARSATSARATRQSTARRTFSRTSLTTARASSRMPSTPTLTRRCV
jgi:hypothetical protein